MAAKKKQEEGAGVWGDLKAPSFPLAASLCRPGMGIGGIWLKSLPLDTNLIPAVAQGTAFPEEAQAVVEPHSASTLGVGI